MVRKIQILRGGAGPEPVVLDKAQPWGLEWDSLGGGCDLVGCPGLGSSIPCEARAEVIALESPGSWCSPSDGGGRAHRYLVYPISLFLEETVSQRR